MSETGGLTTAYETLRLYGPYVLLTVAVMLLLQALFGSPLRTGKVEENKGDTDENEEERANLKGLSVKGASFEVDYEITQMRYTSNPMHTSIVVIQSRSRAAWHPCTHTGFTLLALCSAPSTRPSLG